MKEILMTEKEMVFLVLLFPWGESQNGCLKKTKHAKFFEKGTFLTS